MSPAIPTPASTEMSPRARARLTGVFYLATIVLGLVAEGLIGRRLIVMSDAAATAANIAAHPALYEGAFALYMIELACQLVMTSLFYDLLRPVSRPLATLSAVFGFVGCTIKLVARLFFFAPLLVLGDVGSMGTFTGEQVRALALLLIRINDHGAAIAMIFFGLHAVTKGWLILRSTFFPRALGVLAMVAGMGWLTYVYPTVGYQAFAVIGPVALLSAVAIIGWLLWRGVDEAAWYAQAERAKEHLWR